MSAKILYNKLFDSGIIGSKGEVSFELNGIKTKIQDSSVIGNIIQEWLKSFMKKNNIYFSSPDNSQKFPDFFMDANTNTTGLLEVKCFKKSPNFDIANFSAYCRSIAAHPYRLDADYLIIKYESLTENIIIKDIWLKKVWEISSASERASLKIQWKQNTAVNIRPATWYANNPDYQPFNTRKEFVLAIKSVLDTSQIGGDWRKNWIKNVEKLYFEQTGNEL